MAFPVPGGVIDVAVTQYGLKRTHYVGDYGREQVLHPRSQEGLRARFDRRYPRLSATIGVVGLVVPLVGFAVTLSVAVDPVGRPGRDATEKHAVPRPDGSTNGYR